MIRVKKDFDDIPKILKSDNRQSAFNKNILESKYSDEKNLYKVGSVQKKLNGIYNLKCAYCEKKLLDSPKHIEHYRPKKIYYWLAYSWDNLLLSCGECNSAKSDKFPIVKNRAVYNDEIFEKIHLLSLSYDILEQPQIINPEKDDIQSKIVFDKKGIIFTSDNRIQTTIDICKLNRESLIQLREEIFIDFRKDMRGHLEYYKLKKDMSRFIPTVQTFINNVQIENKFYAFKYFIINNIEIFFEDKLLQKIIKRIIKKLIEKDAN